MKEKIWSCKIGPATSLPPGSDASMRIAVSNAFKALTGEAPEFIFSGWGAQLSHAEETLVKREREGSKSEA